MEELVETARLYYNQSSSDIKEQAMKFFKSLDNDNDGKVSFSEFLEFMKDEGLIKMTNRQFFKGLDKDGNGTLEFMEVMALYYIIKSGRPFCSGCDKFIPGMYFACSKCFNSGDSMFCVCPECFEHGGYVHDHVQFLDNYALLEAKRKQGTPTLSKTAPWKIGNKHKRSSSATAVELPASSTDAAVPHDRLKQQWNNFADKAANVLLKALDSALTTASYGSNCTIM